MPPLSEEQAATVRERVDALVLEMAPIAVAEADPTASLVVDLGFDSLRLVELAGVLEDEFGLAEAGEDELGEVETVGDARELVLRLLADGRATPEAGGA